MVNPLVEIGGEERPVNFGRNALVEFEKITGFSLLDPDKAHKIQSFEGMQTLVFVGLKWGLYKSDGIEPKTKFTILKVGEWLDQDELGYDGPTAKIIKVFEESMPGRKKASAGGSPANR